MSGSAAAAAAAAFASSLCEISIIPLVRIERVRLLSGVYGPFTPPLAVSVPLWLALYLKRKGKALLVAPSWLTLPALTDTLRHETSAPGFADLPFHWLGIANDILQHASDDIPDAARVRATLRDIKEARDAKVRAGVEMLNPVHLEMTGISLHEITDLRPFFTTAFAHLRALRAPEADIHPLPSPTPEPRSESQSQSHWGDSHDNTTTHDESQDAFSLPPHPQASDEHKANVSDSGYYTADRSRSTAPNRPPRFAVDDDDDDANDTF